MKLNIVLVTNDGSAEILYKTIEVDEFFTLSGSVIWKNRYFKAEFSCGPQSDPFPLVEQLPVPIVLD